MCKNNLKQKHKCLNALQTAARMLHFPILLRILACEGKRNVWLEGNLLNHILVCFSPHIIKDPQQTDITDTNLYERGETFSCNAFDFPQVFQLQTRKVKINWGSPSQFYTSQVKSQTCTCVKSPWNSLQPMISLAFLSPISCRLLRSFREPEFSVCRILFLDCSSNAESRWDSQLI